jgi:hypothetical protein
VASSYARMLTPDARAAAPEPMEIDAIEAESRSLFSSTQRGLRSTSDSRQLTCYRCRKPGHCAAVCRAPAPVLASAEVVGDADDQSPAEPVGAGRPTGWNGGPGTPVATGPPNPPCFMHTSTPPLRPTTRG